jgi:heme a synthase
VTPLSSNRSFLIAGRFAGITAALMLGLMVLGSVVRTTGSGLACPDWPLCEGRWIPRFQFNVLVEWWHRTIALLVSLFLFATVTWIWTRRETRKHLGALAGLSVFLLFVQILLGALTVWHLLAPSVVSSHLATALLLFVTVLSIAVIAKRHAGHTEPSTVSGGLAVGLLTVTVLTFVQAVLGGVVSTSHAGNVCPEWPGCAGELFPPLTGLVGLQMMHRYVAYGLLAALAAVAVAARRSTDARIRRGAMVALAIGVTQSLLGILNVYLGTPIWLVAVHLGTATVLFGLLASLTHRAWAGVGSPSMAREPATAS